MLLTEAGESVALPTSPSPPISGWKIITEENHRTIVLSVPCVTPGMPARTIIFTISIFDFMNYVGLVYTYLAGHVGHTGEEGALLVATITGLLVDWKR